MYTTYVTIRSATDPSWNTVGKVTCAGTVYDPRFLPFGKGKVFVTKADTEFPFYVFSKRSNGRWVLRGERQESGPHIVDSAELDVALISLRGI